MNVMISCVILEKQMEDIPRQPESTVIIDGFHNGEAEEHDGCSRGHPWDKEWDGPTYSVE